MKDLIRGLSPRHYALVVAATVFIMGALVMLAQASMDDILLKNGEMIGSNVPTARAGSLYTITAGGRLEPGPAICTPLAGFDGLERHTLSARTRNWLGFNIPLIASLSARVLPGDIPATGAATEVRFDGHTLVIQPATIDGLLERSLRPVYLQRLFAAKPHCETEVLTLYRQNVCVVLVYQTLAFDGNAIGYRYDDLCITMDLGEGDELYVGKPLRAPRPWKPLGARLSVAKDFIGFLVPVVEPAEARGALRT